MPILDSGKKRARQAIKRRQSNDNRRRAMREAVKEVKDLTKKSDTSTAISKLPKAFQSIDKAAKRGVINKKAAARKKSRLAKKLATTK